MFRTTLLAATALLVARVQAQDPEAIRPLASITMGMPPGPSAPAVATYEPGAAPPIQGAPVLPAKFVFTAGQWPAQDKAPDTTTPEVLEWMKELDGVDLPDFGPTAAATCGGDPAAAADAAKRGWWTCGGFTRPDDVVSCPDKLTWGVSFDDGPSEFTPTLLKYLEEKALKATFYVVGSRIIERPEVLIAEYMAGHEIAVHTWSHTALTTMTNAQIVAELGWSRKVIKEVLGVTPTTMRPPYGDIDDRVRAISHAMGLVPMMWTIAPASGPFDTNDWKVAGGLATGVEQQATFQAILGNASTIDTGFIVLQHDLFEITVDLAVGYTINSALTHNPPFVLKPIGECAKIAKTDLYVETTSDKVSPFLTDDVSSGAASPGPSGSASGASKSKATGSGSSTPKATGAANQAGKATSESSAQSLAVSVASMLLSTGVAFALL